MFNFLFNSSASVLMVCAALAFGTLSSCKSKQPASETVVEEVQTQTQTTESVVEILVEMPKDSLILALDLTPCFGRCPVYKVRLYESGFATWEGLNFVERMGLWSTTLSKSEVSKIFDEAGRVGFFGFEEVYDNPHLQDFPAMMLTLTDGAQHHKVTARYEIPKQVKDYFTFVQNAFDRQGWQPYQLRQ